MLRNVDGWLKMNGEAIYGTRAWQIYGEGAAKVTEEYYHDADALPYTAEDFRFTKKGDALYTIEMGGPSDRWRSFTVWALRPVGRKFGRLLCSALTSALHSNRERMVSTCLLYTSDAADE